MACIKDKCAPLEAALGLAETAVQRRLQIYVLSAHPQGLTNVNGLSAQEC